MQRQTNHAEGRASTTTRRTISTIVRSAPASLPHDVGGDFASYGPILLSEENAPNHHDDLQAWEQQCHALFVVLTTKKIVTTDALRATIEALTPQQYNTWTYYEKWSAGMAKLLLDGGIVTHDELSAALLVLLLLTHPSNKRQVRHHNS